MSAAGDNGPPLPAAAAARAPPSVASSSSAFDAPCCRVCWGSDEGGNPLIQPCQCKGSLAYIHRRCLQQWRQVCRENGRRRKAALCDICGAPLVLPGSRLAALAAARAAAAAAAGGGSVAVVGRRDLDLLSTDEQEGEEDDTDDSDGGLGDDEGRRAARRADAADRRLRRRRQRARQQARRRRGDDQGDDPGDDDNLGPFFANGQLVPALDLGAVLADSLRDPLWWAGALHGALRAYVALTGVAAAWRVWAQVLRAKQRQQQVGGGGGGAAAGVVGFGGAASSSSSSSSSASAQVAAALRSHHRAAAVVPARGVGGGHFLQHPHFAFAAGIGGAGGGTANVAALPAAVPVSPPSASALQAAARAAQAAATTAATTAGVGAAAADPTCPQMLLRPYIVREFTQAVEQGAQFQVAAHTTLAALASGADADAYSGLALGAVVASAVSELVFLPLLGAGKRGAADAVARLVGRTAWRLAAGALCTRDGYRLFCRVALFGADAWAGWRARRRRRARRLARERLLLEAPAAGVVAVAPADAAAAAAGGDE
jgi:hypothetical protein